MDAAKYDEKMRPSETTRDGWQWHAPTAPPFRLAGFAWFETDGVYRRLPLEPDWPLPDSLSQPCSRRRGPSRHRSAVRSEVEPSRAYWSTCLADHHTSTCSI